MNTTLLTFFAQVKRVIGHRDERLKANRAKAEAEAKQKAKEKKTVTGELVREIPQAPSHMFFQANEALVPPYNVLVDTNFCKKPPPVRRWHMDRR